MVDGKSIDKWFGTVRAKYAAGMRCGKGCTACCHGLFDISLADAAAVAKGFQGLPLEMQQRVHENASSLHAAIRKTLTDEAQPTIFSEDDPMADKIVDTANNPPCPCLGDSGECLIYDHRPLSCRLEGVPMVDVDDGLFGDWCELNFEEGVPTEARPDLQLDYSAIDAVDEARSGIVAQQAGFVDHRAVTFIPSVIAEYDTFWKSRLS